MRTIDKSTASIIEYLSFWRSTTLRQMIPGLPVSHWLYLRQSVRQLLLFLLALGH